MIRGLLGRDPEGMTLTRNILIAFLPAAILGPFLDPWIESLLMRPGPVLVALGLGGIAMLVTGKWLHDHEQPNLEGESLSATAALQIGLLQCVAMWPGTSRLMMTLLAGMFVGMRPAASARFSFLLALPTIGGATVWKLLKNALGDQPDMFATLGWGPVLVSMGVALVAAFLTVQWLLRHLTTHGLAAFGGYRLGLTLVLVLLVSAGLVSISPEPTPPSVEGATSAPASTPVGPIANTRG